MGESRIILRPLEATASQLDKVAQGLARKVLKISKDGDLTAFLRQPAGFPLLQLVSLACCNITVCLWHHLLCNHSEAVEGDSNIPTSSFLLFRLNNPPSVSSFSYTMCSSPLIVLVTLHWTWSSLSMSFLY